jgi:hypothetical protein
MDCKQVIEFCDGGGFEDLEPQAQRAVQMHIRSCPCCNTLVQSYKTTAALCAEVWDLPIPEQLTAGLKHYLRHATGNL